jgi:O-antigen/teichoic acid export membrane protein
VYAGYGVLGSVGNKIATRIDEVMITTLLGEGFTGIFFISAVIGNVVDIPRRALSKISSPVIAESIKNEDWANVQKLYQKTALNQFLVGLFILLGIWLSVDDIFLLMPNGDIFLVGKQVILILGITNIVNMATGVNEEIIGYSRYFRYKFYFILCLALFNVMMNFIFIRLYGINGAALATLSSITLYNILKFGLIQIKLKMQPFTIQMLYVLVLALLSYGLIAVLPMPEITLLAMLIKSAAFTLIFGLSVLYFRVSPDINLAVADVWQRVLKWWR